MRLNLTCAECAARLNDNPDAGILPTSVQPFKNSPCYEFTCPQGHINRAILQNARWEILADVAAQAIEDTYYREAVTSFNASLERFYELAYRVLTWGRFAQSDIDATWSTVAKQSERQLGLYHGVYLMALNKSAPVLPSGGGPGSVAFRNLVVHQGVIPTENEAIVFGQAVIDVIQPVLTRFRSEYSRAMNAIEVDYIARARASHPNWADAPLVFQTNIYDHFRNGLHFNLQEHINTIKSKVPMYSIYAMSSDGRVLRNEHFVSASG